MGIKNEKSEYTASEYTASIEPIYQIADAVRDFNRLAQKYKEVLIQKLVKPCDSKTQEEIITPFFLLRHAWSRSGLKEGFQYTYFHENSFNPKKAKNIVNSINRVKGNIEPLREHWDALIGYLIKKNKVHKKVKDAWEWLQSESKTYNPKVSYKNSSLLYYHILQIYSHFPVSGFIADALYDFRNKLGPDEKTRVTGYLIELLKNKGKGKFPKLCIYDLSRGKDECRDQKDEIEDLRASALFTKYLDPCFNGKDFNGETFNAPENYTGMKMIFLPLYGECTDGKYSGHFLGWLMQSIPKDVAKILNFNQLNKIEQGTLLEYINKCSELSNLLAQTLLDANVREILDQELGDRECHEFLQQEFCLLGGCKEAKVENRQTIKTVVKRNLDKQYFWPDAMNKCLWIDLNPVLPEQHSKDFIKPEDVGEQSWILKLDFNADYLQPSHKRRKEHYNKIAKLAYLIYRELIENKWRKNRIIKHGTRAAVAAIMGRNMSHNIGSHVLSYWKNVLEKDNSQICTLLTELNKGYQINNQHRYLFNKFDQGNAIEKKNENSIERSYFLFDYLKNRMDFIAEITTTPPSWEKSMLFNEEILKPFTKQTALLDNIIKSEGFCYVMVPNKCKKIKYSESNCNSCERLEGISSESNGDGPVPFVIEIGDQETPVSIPHGVIGMQAVYSILENFIRNSAKHGGGKVKKNKPSIFEIIIKTEDVPDDDYVAVTIMDNVGNCNDIVNDAKGKRKRIIDLLQETIYDGKESGYVDDSAPQAYEEVLM